jgi:hypothetical protein
MVSLLMFGCKIYDNLIFLPFKQNEYELQLHLTLKKPLISIRSSK